MKIGIVTIIDRNNYGNRLQSYALNYYCNNILKINTYTLDNKVRFNNKKKLYYKIIVSNIKSTIKKIIKYNNKKDSNYRLNNFIKFDNNIKYYKKFVTAGSNLNEFDYLIVGSDQVWNPNFGRLSDLDILKYANPSKRVSYAASFGINDLDNNCKERVKQEISKFKSISVREDRAKEIIEEITDRNDAQVLIDPTMLLTDKEWDKVSIKPDQINRFNGKKYILNYFLGELSEKRKKEIERIAKENDCEIINILDKNDPFYIGGPGEFLYLEKNAFLICTDSFHSSVFAILYNRPFIIFDREQQGMANMNSRLDTLLSKFELKNRRYNGESITKDNLEHDYSEAYNILEKEREKSKNFLEKALNIKIEQTKKE